MLEEGSSDRISGAGRDDLPGERLYAGRAAAAEKEGETLEDDLGWEKIPTPNGDGGVVWDTLEDELSRLGEPAGMNSVHKLLHIAYDYCKDENGFALLSAAGSFIKDVRPELNYRSYGFHQLHQLLQAYPDRYELVKRPGRGMAFRCCA